MTAITPDMVSGSSVQRRLGELLQEDWGRAGWWVEITRRLDDLAESVRTAPGDLADVPGFTEQIRADAPHLMSRWQRLAGERDGLYDAVTQVRLLAGRNAGDPGAVPVVSRAIRDLLARVRRFQERTTEVLLDAYERDMGGE
jgi:hypothetical protein